MIGLKRNITEKITNNLENDLILLLVGSRQAGKTTILKQVQEYLVQKSFPVFFLNLEDPTYLEVLNKHPRNILKIFQIDQKIKNYLIIDEVQYLKNPTNFLKYIYDEFKDAVKLIVSGSSAFYIDEKFKDSLAGRKKIFEVRTLSFQEFLYFKGREDLNKNGAKALPLERDIQFLYDEYITWGGFPRIVLANISEKKDLLQELAYSYIKKDIYESKIKNGENVYKLLKMLSAQAGGLVNANELSRTLGVSKTAVENYLYILQKSYHLALIKPFYRNIRKELTKMPKVFFYDLGLRNFFYGDFSPPETRRDLGILLENAVFRQLLDKLRDIDKIKFWRTPQKNEVDFIVDEKEAFEVKSDSASFRRIKYKPFNNLYPEIKINLISYRKSENIESIRPYEIF